MTRLAYLGPPGTFSEEAAARYRPDAQLLPLASEVAVTSAVEARTADEGVLAIENSLEGSVTRSLDALIHDSSLAICGELILPVQHCLIGRAGTVVEEIEAVYSHPQVFGQCRKFLQRCLPDARQEAALSTAAAVESALQLERAAAIAPARAADLHGAHILAEGIQDSEHNKTRFVAIGSSDSAPSGHDKTSIAFSVEHDRPGTLVDVLHEFSDRAINLTKIESRPSREELGIYIFLVDLEGHRSEPKVAAALDAVQAKAFFFRMLGSYPQYRDAGDP